MMEIRFSHRYTKLIFNGQCIPERATLMEVVSIDVSKLSETFIEYDTAYWNETGTRCNYELPKTGEFYLLIFRSADGHMFTTLRKNTEKTTFKYQYNIGNGFKIKVMDRTG